MLLFHRTGEFDDNLRSGLIKHHVAGKQRCGFTGVGGGNHPCNHPRRKDEEVVDDGNSAPVPRFFVTFEETKADASL